MKHKRPGAEHMIKSLGWYLDNAVLTNDEKYAIENCQFVFRNICLTEALLDEDYETE